MQALNSALGAALRGPVSFIVLNINLAKIVLDSLSRPQNRHRERSTVEEASKLRELADKYNGNSDLKSALRLGAGLIYFQGKKIDQRSKEIELFGWENETSFAPKLPA